jgi:YesN/AraC family two-component response regulator
VKKAFEMGCTVYSVKPIDLDKLKVAMKKLGLAK